MMIDYEKKFPHLFNTTAYKVDVAAADVLAREYQNLRACAPRRSCRGKKYFCFERKGVFSDQTGTNRREEHYAGALRIRKQKLPREDGGWLCLLDYQFPLKAWQADKGVGKIDLLGATNQGRLVVIELKMDPQKNGRAESPPKVLLQGLRYAAIVEANHEAIASEANQLFDINIGTQKPIIQLLAPLGWWHDWLARDTAETMAFNHLIVELETKLGVSIECMALGDAKLTMGTKDKAATLDRMPDLHPVHPAETPPIGEALAPLEGVCQ